MTRLKQSRREDSKGVTLEQLLRFKKAERPDAAFWEDFDRSLEQKLFKTVVERRRSPLRNFFYVVLHARSTYAMPVLAAIMVGLGIAINRGTSDGPLPQAIASQPVDMVVSVEAHTMASAPGTERFVVDKLNSNSDAGSFRKVMAIEAINTPRTSSTRYVADQLGTSSGRNGVLYVSDSF
ncbi:MAG TPA: hypothetical protein PKI32_08905 [Opitutales bacterium]|nr:hypothetical protein [Opitutales bacterium]